MSNLRQVSKKDSPEGDIEAPSDRPKITPPGVAPSGPRGINNPVFLAKVIMNKVVALLVSSDEEDITRPGGIITLLKDVIVGVIMGVMTISAFIFLDHLNIVHFQSAHSFRNAAFQLLNDPETIANIEEATEYKFITISDYEAKMKEISSVTEKLEGHKKVLERREAEAEEKKKEADGIRGEYESLMASPLLKLDKFCEGCSWSGKTTCIGRVTFLQETYNTRPIAAKVNAMLHESCINKD